MPDDSVEKPKKKRGRPKGSKNKPKSEEVQEQQFETKLGEIKPEQSQEKEPKKELKETPTQISPLTPPRSISVESFTNKRGFEVIFRREMGEPEFFLHKNQLAPPRPVLTKEEEEEISKKVQIPTDQIPKYEPEHILSPEFGGHSNYERGIDNYKLELQEKLQHLKGNADVNAKQIEQIEEELRSLDHLYENYFVGMNIFRTAKGGRSKLRA